MFAFPAQLAFESFMINHKAAVGKTLRRVSVYRSNARAYFAWERVVAQFEIQKDGL